MSMCTCNIFIPRLKSTVYKLNVYNYSLNKRRITCWIVNFVNNFLSNGG